MTGAALMAEKPDKTEKPKRKDAAVKIDADIAWKAKAICSYRKTTVAEFLSGFLKPIIDKEFDKWRKEVAGR